MLLFACLVLGVTAISPQSKGCNQRLSCKHADLLYWSFRGVGTLLHDQALIADDSLQDDTLQDDTLNLPVWALCLV